MHYDVFNGDADGLCSVAQLRLAWPRESEFVTGTKRDIALLDRVHAGRGDSVTVLDVSAATNRAALDRIAGAGAAVEYFDHHDPGPLPLPHGVVSHIDTAPGVCTGILVDRHLGGTQRPWAVTAAFGDNLVDEARALAVPLGLAAGEVQALRDLGDGLTHNSYSDRLEDAVVPPAELARALIAARDPLRFIATHRAYAAIDAARRHEVALAREVGPARVMPGAAVYLLPDAGWARRVRGLLGNEVANADPERAHAVVTVRDDGDYAVSVRAPRALPLGAGALCRAYGGNGREAAGGIGRLPRAALDDFVARLAAAYPGG
ncbi:MAG: acetyltransferase [Burkholderiales bacterium]